MYVFARVIPLAFVSLLDLGAFHGAEIAYVFGSTPTPSSDDAVLGTRMQEYWTRFADRGKPKATKAKGWPRFKTKSYRSLGLLAPDLVKSKGYRRAECDFWSSYYEQLD
jgi:carboxylesterase type B